MRTPIVQAGGLRGRAITGTHTVLVALDLEDQARKGLLGFGFQRQEGDKERYWLRGKKVFRSVVPQPAAGQSFSTAEQPIQSLLWGDYTAKPGTTYKFSIVPMYGSPKKLEPGEALELDVSTEIEKGKTHCVWFNRGAIASQAFAEKFKNEAPPRPDDPADPETAWLSRGLLEACLDYIDSTPAGDGLRVAAYEFTYPPALLALKRAFSRGVDLKIIYEAGSDKVHGEWVETSTTKENRTAIDKLKLPAEILIERTRRANIPHNKFIVRLDAQKKPRSVWTGSTNFTSSGFLGQSNVGHLVNDTQVAATYLRYWDLLSKDPAPDELQDALATLTPEPADRPEAGTTCLFSPRHSAKMLDWYAKRITEAQSVVLFTGAFGVNEKLAVAFAADRDFLRYLMLEKPPTRKVMKLLGKDKDIIVVPGQVLGQIWEKNDKGELVLRRPVQGFELERWFLHEEHFRKAGNIFFVHLKNLIVDPLSDDPLVFTGSANFSEDSLVGNDENMLLIRGDTRVADIYMTEYDRLIRHFYFRDMAAELHGKGDDSEAVFLREDDSWLGPYFTEGSFKSRRRTLFIPPG